MVSTHWMWSQWLFLCGFCFSSCLSSCLISLMMGCDLYLQTKLTLFFPTLILLRLFYHSNRMKLRHSSLPRPPTSPYFNLSAPTIHPSIFVSFFLYNPYQGLPHMPCLLVLFPGIYRHPWSFKLRNLNI